MNKSPHSTHNRPSRTITISPTTLNILNSTLLTSNFTTLTLTTLTLALALSLTGCLVGPNYHRPCIETPSEWQTTLPQTRPDCDLNWWEQFNDPVLSDLVKIAVQENKDLRIATARVDEFLGRYRITRSELYPQIYGTATPGRERFSEKIVPVAPGVSNPDNIYQAFLTSSWEIDFWGRIRRASEAARAELLATEEGRLTVISTLVSSVAASYINLLQLDRQLEISVITTESRKKTLDLFQSRYDAGVISKIELSQIQSEYQSSLATIPVFEALIAKQEHDLNLLLGQNPTKIPRGGNLDTLTFPCIPEALPSDLLFRRPEIREAEQLLIAANARIGVARAAYFPSISLTGAYGSASRDLADLFTGGAQAWNYYIPVSVPLFTAGRIAGEVEATKAVREQALANYEKQIQSAFASVENGLIAFEKLGEELKAKKAQVEALKTYASLAKLRYDEGYASYLEVLDSERSLFQAELELTNTKSNHFLAIVALYKAMGGGWIYCFES